MEVLPVVSRAEEQAYSEQFLEQLLEESRWERKEHVLQVGIQAKKLREAHNKSAIWYAEHPS